jgi:amino-acid N-acetyltransferase
LTDVERVCSSSCPNLSGDRRRITGVPADERRCEASPIARADHFLSIGGRRFVRPRNASDGRAMTAVFTIRAATPNDLGAVEAALRDSELPLDGLHDQFGDAYAVAECDGRVIGVEGIEVHGEDGLLRSAAVVATWRGKGVGDALTRDRIEWARRRGLRSLYLLTTTAGDYFPRFGFERANRDLAPLAVRNSREFAEACPSTALFMALPLRGEARS